MRRFISLLLALLIVTGSFSPAYAYAAETGNAAVTTEVTEAEINTIQQTGEALTSDETDSEGDQTAEEATDPSSEPTQAAGNSF